MTIFKNFPLFLEKLGRKRVIYDRQTNLPYMDRYYILFKDRPSWFPFNVVMHHVKLSDPAGLHDHPWGFMTIILKGGYWETTPEGKFWRKPFRIRIRSANAFHRLEIDKEKAKGETWTLFFMGRRIKDWGFLNKQGKWTQWEEYLKSEEMIGINII